MRFLVLLALLTGVAHAETSRVERGYREGRPIKIRVVELDGFEVEVATARAFRKMEAAAHDDGVRLAIRSGFRSHKKQKELYRAWRAGQGNMAARPGFSNHQSGRALDLVVDDTSFEWLVDHARRYGFRRTVRREAWHWEFVGVPKQRAIARGSSRHRRS